MHSKFMFMNPKSNVGGKMDTQDQNITLGLSCGSSGADGALPI